MSSPRNRNHPLHAATPVARVHCVRVRRMMGRKHQLQRREHCSSSSSPSAYVSANTSTATATATEHGGVYHHHNNNSNTRRSGSSNATPTTIPTGPLSTHRRHHLATERRLFLSEGHYRDEEEGAYTLMPTTTATGAVSPFSLGCSSTNQYSHQRCDGEALGSSMMPPFSFSPLLASNGSFSFFDAYSEDEEDSMENSIGPQRYLSQHGGASKGNARAHSSGGGGSGGGGGSDGSGATAPADMAPGGGDATDGDQPSDYTFRRRNAIVEGSDDAPKAEDFPSASPK